MNLMPGIGFFEMVLLVVVAIVVIGPKELPLMMRKFGRFTGKMRAMAFEFKQGFDELGRQAELEELRKEVADLRKHTGIDDIQKDLEDDRINLEKDVSSAMEPGALPSPATSSPGTPAPGTPALEAKVAEEKPAVPPYAGLSADHPGYDTGEDFKPAGHGPMPAPEPEPDATPEDKPEPARQDTPA
jgi:sec-independent protein translocase protein TatB